LKPSKETTRLSLDAFEDFDVKRFFESLWYRRHLLLALFLVTLVLASIYVFKIPPYYTASVRIMLLRQKPAWTPVKEAGWRSEVWYEGQDNIEIIKSAATVLKAGYDIGLDKKWNIKNDTKFYKRLKGLVDAKLLPDTKITDIIVTSGEPEIASDLANAVYRSYTQIYFQEEYRPLAPLLELFPNVVDVSDLESITYEDMRNMDLDRAMQIVPTVATDLTLTTMQKDKMKEEFELVELLRSYREKHPKVIQKKAIILHLEDEMHSQILKIIDSMRVNLLTQLTVSNIKLISAATIPQLPAGPDRLAEMLKIVIFELMTSCTLVMLINYFRQTINSDYDLEKIPGLVHMGYVPKISPKQQGDNDLSIYVLHNPNSKFAEMIRNIRVSIDFSIDRVEDKCILITSSLPEEGKSLFTTNLALAYAQDNQKVLIVDADLRRPTIAKGLALEHDHELIHFLTSQCKFEDVICPTEIKNLSAVISKTQVPNPVEILNSKRMKQFLDKAKECFDKVMIDSPPVIGLSDSLILSNQVNVTFLVICARKTQITALKKSIIALEHADARVVGAIINQIDSQTERYYYKNYRYSYSKYLNKT